jgi:CRISPR-associated protein (TIGR02710 family)
MATSTGQSTVLFLTVGAGNPARLEETLYRPTSLSIETGHWTRVVLLPSRDTIEHARELKRRHAARDVHIRPLPDGVSENDADGCYDHFQRVIAELGMNFPSKAVDITRGTKAMSAALLLAAFRHRIDAIRYMEGDRDPQNPGIILPGSERIRDIDGAAATRHRTMDEARLLLMHYDFAAAAHMLRQLPPSDDVQYLIRIADFYAAWDRLDYRTADEVHIARHLPPDWAPYVPSPEARQWVHHLAQPFPDCSDPDYAIAMAARLRRLIVDLLANARRRVRQRPFEDALLRAYRVLEMLGQARLFDYGLDSAALPANHEQVRRLQADLEKKRSAGFGVNHDGTLNAGRELVARLLKRLEDPLAEDLLRLGQTHTAPITSRNRSILVHGFEAAWHGDEAQMCQLYEDLTSLARRDRELSGRDGLAGFEADHHAAAMFKLFEPPQHTTESSR